MCILVRLVQLNWNFHVIGWNVTCLYLAPRLFWKRDGEKKENQMVQGRVQHGRGQPATPPCTLMSIGAFALFVAAPALVVIGALDPYLGNANYSKNHPQMQMKLSLGGSLDGTWLDGLASAPVIDKELRTDFTTLRLKTTGDVGYPAAWVFQRFADSICNGTRTGGLQPLLDAHFRITLPWTGRQLVAGMFGAGSQPPVLVRNSCAPNAMWTFHECEDDDGYAGGTKQCRAWASAGECVANRRFMRDFCRRSCGLCDRRPFQPASFAAGR